MIQPITITDDIEYARGGHLLCPDYAAKDSHCRADYSDLVNSIDIMMKLQQRSAEICSHMATIDELLITSRDVVALSAGITGALETLLDLTVARILCREDHPMAGAMLRPHHPGLGFAPQTLLEDANPPANEPFILDDPGGDLARSLFGEAAVLLSSGVVAPLSTEEEELGFLCLGSDDASRYCQGVNTEFIASLARRIALGLRNAMDHEKRNREALLTDLEDVHTEPFFEEFLQKEFSRAWRYHKIFSLMALSCRSSEPGADTPPGEFMGFVKSNIRSSDVLATGRRPDAWLLLPETDIIAAGTVADRLVEQWELSKTSPMNLHIGITEFSTAACVASSLTRETMVALEDAERHDKSSLVARPVTLQPIEPAGPLPAMP
ncbi:hypothetical protein ACFL2Q_04070 [Thermodesulfobacteriota bacterium]